jgi:hypothetical protein
MTDEEYNSRSSEDYTAFTASGAQWHHEDLPSTAHLNFPHVWTENDYAEAQSTAGGNGGDDAGEDDEDDEDDYDEAAAVQALQQMAMYQPERVPGSYYVSGLFFILYPLLPSYSVPS